MRALLSFFCGGVIVSGIRDGSSRVPAAVLDLIPGCAGTS